MSFEIWGLQDFRFPWPWQPGDVLPGLAYGILLVYLLARSGRPYGTGRRVGNWAWVVLIALSALLSVMFVVRFPAPDTPLLPDDVLRPPVAPLLGWVPIALAALLGGPLEAILTGITSGIVRAGMGAGGFTMPLEMGIGAWAAAALISQRYRGRIMRALRHPVLAVPTGSLGWWAAMVLSELARSGIPVLLAVEQAWKTGLAALPAVLLEAFVGGLVAEGVWYLWPELSPAHGKPMESPPWERSLGNLVVMTFLPVLSLGAVLLIGTVTSVALDAATGWASAQLEQEASGAASLVPIFTHTGITLITEIANDVDDVRDDERVEETLREGIGRIPFFDRLFLFDDEGGELLAAYPPPADDEAVLLPEESEVIGDVREVAASQGPAAVRGPDGRVWVSFGAPVSVDGEIVGVPSWKRAALSSRSWAVSRMLPTGMARAS